MVDWGMLSISSCQISVMIHILTGVLYTLHEYDCSCLIPPPSLPPSLSPLYNTKTRLVREVECGDTKTRLVREVEFGDTKTRLVREVKLGGLRLRLRLR